MSQEAYSLAALDPRELSCWCLHCSVSAHTGTPASEVVHTTSVSDCLNPATLPKHFQRVVPDGVPASAHELHSTS